MRNIFAIMSSAALALLLNGCGIYTFSGTSIQSDVHTITIDYVEYKALRVNPSLAGDLTDALKEKYRKMTKLEQVDMDGDMEVACSITGYDTRAMAVTADEVAAKNRLTVTVKCDFTNRKYPEDDFSKSFSAYADYDSTNSLDAVESSLCEEIIDQLVEDILNATVANW
jgi:hypothetical protein